MHARKYLLASAMLSGLLTLAAPLVLAQEPVHGVLRGHAITVSGRPVTTASVRLLELHREEPTHGNGEYVFHDLHPADYTVQVRAIGYHPETRRVTITPADTVTLDFLLLESAVELQEIVVTGSLDSRGRDEVLSPTAVLGGAALDRRVGQTVGATLQDQPGVTVSSLGPATARPVIRGLSGDRILILEDGLRPGDLSSTSADHAVAIEPLTADQIEVVRGPMSLLYGSSALGGVVNVIRNEIPASQPEHLHGNASVVGSSVNNGLSGGAHLSSPLAGLAVRVEGSALHLGDVRTPVGRIEGTQAETWSIGLGVARVEENSHGGIAYRYYDNAYGIPGGFIGGHASDVDIAMRRHSLRAGGEHHSDGHFLSGLRADAVYTDYAHTETEPSGALGTSFGQKSLAGDLVVRHEARGILAQGAAGIRGQYRDITTGGTLHTPSTYDWSVAGYTVEELGRGSLRIQLGARYDFAHYVPREKTFISVGGQLVPVRPRSFGSFSGSAGLLYHVSEGLRVGGSVSRAYRTPDFNELYSSGPHLAANSFDVGDPNLEAETGLGLDTWVRYSTGPIRLEAAAFRNTLNGYIFPSSRGRAELGSQGGRPRFQYTNEDARFEGLEGQAALSFTRNLVFEGTLNWVRATFTSTRDSLPIITPTDTTFIAPSKYPPFIPPLGGRVELRFEKPSWFVAGGTRFTTAQNRTGDFEAPTGGYALLNLSAGVRLHAGGRLHAITLRADNVTNREYRDHLSRLKEILPEPGVNVSLLYRFTF